jgi:hypothetical protein
MPLRVVAIAASMVMFALVANAPVAGAARPTKVAAAADSVPAPSVASQLAGLRLINYFPEAHSWGGMWTDWQPAVLKSDFDRIAALNANAVRITVFPSVFGYPTPSTQMQDRFAQLLRIAQAAGVKVQLSIFDQFTSWSDISGSEQWARDLLSPYRSDPNIAFVDLRNELDPFSVAQVAWARQLLPFVKSVVGSTPLTVSKSGSGAVRAFCELKTELAPVTPDFWDWHFYGVEGLAYGFFRKAQECASPQPLFIGEVGFSAYPDGGVAGLADNAASYSSYQAYYYRVVADAATRLGIPAIAPWMLTDLNAAGAPPQPSASEYYYGLYRTDGAAQPAAAVIKSYFAGRPIDESFNGGFESVVSDSSGSIPALWRRSDTADGTFESDTSVAHTGSASVRATGTSSSDDNAPGLWAVPVNSHVVPGQTVAASVWGRGQNAKGDNRLSISFFDTNGVYCGQIESPSVPSGSTGWAKLTASGTVPPDAAYVRLYLKSSDNSGTVWFDDVDYPGPVGSSGSVALPVTSGHGSTTVRPTRLSLTAPHDALYGAKERVSGALRTASGPVADAVIRVRVPGALKWRSTVTHAHGRFSIVARVRRSGRIKAVYGGAPGRLGRSHRAATALATERATVHFKRIGRRWRMTLTVGPARGRRAVILSGWGRARMRLRTSPHGRLRVLLADRPSVIRVDAPKGLRDAVIRHR